MALLPILSGIGQLAGAIGGGRAKGRKEEAEYLIQKQQADLAAARHQAQLPFIRGAAGARGDLLANVQPAAFTGSGRNLRMTGGLSPALLSSGTRQIGQTMNRQALLSTLGQGGAQDPYASFDTGKYLPPKPGKLDKILGFLGLGGGAADLYSSMRGK